MRKHGQPVVIGAVALISVATTSTWAGAKDGPESSLSKPAAPHLLFVAGLRALGENERYFEQEAGRAYDAARGWGDYRPQLVVDNGRVSFGARGAVSPARSPEDVTRAIRDAGRQAVASGQPLLLFLSDHGDPPSSAKDPLSAGIVLSMSAGFPGVPTAQSMSYREMLVALREQVPATVPIRIVATNCFAGGVHHIAFDLPNACAAATTDFRTTALSLTDQHDYSRAFLERIQPNAQGASGRVTATLADAHRAGVGADPLNRHRGSLSSEDFVDFIVHAGPYDPYIHDREAPTRWKDKLDAWLNPKLPTPTSGFIDTEAVIRTCDPGDLVGPLQNLLSAAKSVHQIVGRLTPEFADVERETRKASEDLRKEWRASVRRIEEVRDRYVNIESDLEHATPGERSRLLTGYNATVRKLQQDLGPLWEAYERIIRAQRLEQFLTAAKPEELDTYRRLRRCEGEPLGRGGSIPSQPEKKAIAPPAP